MTTEIRDWTGMKDMYARLLVERTGQNMDTWNLRVREQHFADEQALRAWLTEQGVTGYPQALLVMEQFGWPVFMTASAEDLIEGQYADRPNLRPIYDAILAEAAGYSGMVIQARKTYVSLMTPKRTFARIQPTTRTRLDLALRLSAAIPGGRLVRSRIQETMPVQVGLSSVDEIDEEVRRWLRAAYEENQ